MGSGSTDGTTFIYGLADPISGAVRYVGKADNPQKRLVGHLKDTRNCHRAHWIQSLVEKGLRPALVIIQKVAKTEWQEWERYWISLYTEAGQELTNGTSGGDGVVDPSLEVRKKQGVSKIGKKRTMESRAKQSVALKGKKHTPESYAKQSATLTGKKHSPERRAKLIGNKYGHGNQGHKKTPEHCAKLSAANKGHKATPETRAKQSAALMGNQHLLGFKPTQETCTKHSVAMKAWWALRRVQKQMTVLVDQAREERNNDAR